MKSERGNAGSIILTIVMVIVVAVAGFGFAINLGMLPAPAFLADQPWMAFILPPEEEEEEAPAVEISLEANLRTQAVSYRNERDVALATIADMEKDLADINRLLQERDDEISRLRDTVNLAQNSNLNSVALIYEAMNSQDAADALAIIGPEQSALILGAMRENKAADVMELMDETLIVEITRLMAGFDGSGVAPPPASGSPSGSGPAPPE